MRAALGPVQTRERERPPPLARGADLHADPPEQAFALPDRATVKRLVSEDNADRAQLYAEIAKANNHPEWEADIRKSFAKRWVATGAQPGWYYQDDSGAWKQK